MADEVINSYEFYVKNFPYIKFMIDERYINHDKNILLVIFYDNDLFQKYLNLRKSNNFMNLIQNYFNDAEIYNNEENGVFMIQGDLINSIDFVINDIFGEKRGLTEKEVRDIEVDDVKKNNHCFYISMIKIFFFDDKGKSIFKFNEIKRNFSEEDN